MSSHNPARSTGVNVTMHIAQVAFALLAAGAAVLLVAGLVLEELHKTQEPLGRFGAPPDRLTQTVSPDPAGIEGLEQASPFAHSRGDHTDRDKQDRSPSDGSREARRRERKKRRRKEKGKASERRSRRSGPARTTDVIEPADHKCQQDRQSADEQC
jgi:hypothetical protein